MDRQIDDLPTIQSAAVIRIAMDNRTPFGSSGRMVPVDPSGGRNWLLTTIDHCLVPHHNGKGLFKARKDLILLMTRPEGRSKKSIYIPAGLAYCFIHQNACFKRTARPPAATPPGEDAPMRNHRFPREKPVSWKKRQKSSLPKIISFFARA